jgi:hypothetical protein
MLDHKICVAIEKHLNREVNVLPLMFVIRPILRLKEGEHLCFAKFKSLLTHTFLYHISHQWGTWKSGVSLVNTGIRHPGSVMKNVIPIVMAGGKFSLCCHEKRKLLSVVSIHKVLTESDSLNLLSVIGIYGLIISVILAESIPRPNDQRQNIYSIYTGMAHVSYFGYLL